MADYSKTKKQKSIKVEDFKKNCNTSFTQKKCCHLPGVNSGHVFSHPPLWNGGGFGEDEVLSVAISHRFLE